jgi:hypothetical protein
MRELFANPDFKDKLLDILSNEGLHEGAICPSGCGGVLRKERKNWFEFSFKHREVDLLTCKCGFQHKPQNNTDSEGFDPHPW